MKIIALYYSDMNDPKENIGLVADLIAVGTFIISLFDIALPNFSVIEIQLGEAYSPSRLFMTSLIVYSTCYFTTTRVAQRMSRYDSDMNSGLYLDALITAFTGWIYAYSLTNVLSYDGAQSELFFSLTYFLCIILYYYFYHNNYLRIQSITTHKAVPAWSSIIIFYAFWGGIGKGFDWLHIGGFSFAFFWLGMGVFWSREVP